MTEQFAAKFKWMDEEILLDNNGNFHVCLTDDSYSSLSAAKEAISKKKAQIAKVGKRKLSLPVITGNGTKHNITGIHSGNGARIFTPKIGDRREAIYSYPDVPAVCKLIARKLELKAEHQEIEKQLAKVQLYNDPYFGRSGFELDVRYDQVEKNYVLQKTAAEGMGK